MAIFRTLLVSLFLYLAIYTSIVIANEGWNLFTIFFGDMGAFAWPGQFNTDFAGFLVLSATWLAWRNEFSPTALALAVCGFFGGIMFLAPYLFIMSYRVDGDMGELLLGVSRARKLKDADASAPNLNEVPIEWVNIQ